jgi:hypothetical protein
MEYKEDPLAKKLGNSPSNINIIKNFMPENHMKDILDYTDLYLEKTYSPELKLKIQKSWASRELLKAYEFLLRAEATKYYGLEFERDRTIDINNREIGAFVPEHTDMIKPHFFDPLEPDFSWANMGYSWSGHLSLIVYLNDDFEGGELIFPQHNITIVPEKGMLVMFPGNLNFVHEVKEVTAGERKTISLWTKFKDFR